MHSIVKMARSFWLPLSIFLLFLILCIYRLPETYAVNGDMARDSLQSLRILKSRDITFIGPPLSIGQLGTHVTYFSSAIYYIGALGLAISGLSLLGPVILIALFNASAVFPLYQLIKQKTTDPFLHLLGLLVYVTNPIAVLYSRLFWNPSPLIGLGIWGLYFLGRSPIAFGIIAALAVYFHYFGVLLLIYGVIQYLSKKQHKECLRAVLSAALCISPFLLFEIRNKFYLTSSFLFNITHSSSFSPNFWHEKAIFFLEMPFHLLGLLHDPFSLRLLSIGGVAMWAGMSIWIFVGIKNKKRPEFWYVVAAAITTALASQTYIRIQYFFIAFGAVWTLHGIQQKRFQKAFLVAIILLQSLNTAHALSSPVHVAQGEAFPTISQLEEVSRYIAAERQNGKSVNITENIRGDARAIYVRYFLEKNNLPDLSSELDYQHVDELFVLTPSLEKTVTENRWEFTASGNTHLESSEGIGQWYILKFVKPHALPSTAKE